METVAHGLALDAHWDQEDRRAALDVASRGLCPNQKTKGEEQCVGTPLLQTQTGGAFDLGKATRKVALGHGGVQSPLGHLLAQVIGQGITTRLLLVQGGVAGVGLSPSVRFGPYAKSFVTG